MRQFFPTGIVFLLLSGCAKTTADIHVRTVTVSTLAGNGVMECRDGMGIQASFDTPWGLTVDARGNVYVADWSDDGQETSRIRMITPAGAVTTLTGPFRLPEGLAVDDQNNIYIGDAGNDRICKRTSAGIVNTLAGYPGGPFFAGPQGVAVDAGGNLYIADGGNSRIRKVSATGDISTLAGSGFGYPVGVAVDLQGNVYVADLLFQVIRKITPTGVVSTLAGSTAGFADGTGSEAKFSSPTGVAVDRRGNVYVADQGNNCIRVITPAGAVSTLAGNGSAGYADGTGAVVQFRLPYAIALDKQGNAYVSDQGNVRIRKITIQ